jgi:hypothetical protein
MRRGKLNYSAPFSPAPSQVPNEGQAKRALKTKSPNPQRTALAAQHGAGQDSSPGQAVRRRHPTNALTSNTVALPSGRGCNTSWLGRIALLD